MAMVCRVFRVMKRIPIGSILLAIVACSAPKQTTRPSSGEQTTHPVIRAEIGYGVHHGRGIACEVNGAVGPISYSVNDIGKEGTPRLSSVERQKVMGALKWYHARTIRYALINMTPSGFVVYDARDGPCASVGNLVLLC